MLVEIKHFTLPYNGIVKQILTNATISFGGKSRDCVALWDTGATGSCIDDNIAKELNLSVISKTEMYTPSTSKPEEANIYLADIKLPNNVSVKNANVCGSKIGQQGIGLLVGMDIISKGDLAISNFNNRTIFSFRYPACDDINFVGEARYKDLIKNNKHGKGKRKK